MFAKDSNRRKSRPGSRSRSKDHGSDSNSASVDPSGKTSGSASGRTTGSDFTSLSGHASRGTRGRRRRDRFVLYVEGARDREILECWARRVDLELARCIERSTIILGGRQPARAVTDFKKRGGASAGYSGVVVLDRDDHEGEFEVDAEHPTEGLEVFVWSLRHIESYLLVPAAIRRMLELPANDRSVEQIIEHNLRNDSVAAPGASLHAKRILGAGGSLSEALGSELRPGEIARAMRIEDLHVDVRVLLDRIAQLSGQSVKGPEVVIRSTARLLGES